jgi:hypothetical protein
LAINSGRGDLFVQDCYRAPRFRFRATGVSIDADT